MAAFCDLCGSRVKINGLVELRQPLRSPGVEEVCCDCDLLVTKMEVKKQVDLVIPLVRAEIAEIAARNRNKESKS